MNNTVTSAKKEMWQRPALERTLREEMWTLTNELFLPTDTPTVAALQLLLPRAWEEFVAVAYDNADLKFFNTETKEFSNAKTWEELSVKHKIKTFDDDLAIPEDVPENVKHFCREFRNEMRARKDEYCGGCKAFYSPTDWVDPVGNTVVLVVCHDGGAVASGFNLDYERYELYDGVDVLLRKHGLWREHYNSAVTHIYPLD